MGSRKLNLRSLNLNLLVVFDAMITEGTVTKAGRALSLSQSAISNSIAQLRQVFGDPLFTRVKNEMVPTPRALALATPIRAALAQLRAAVVPAETFTPAQATRTFRIGMTDYSAFVLLPHLMREIRRQSKGIKVTIRSVTVENMLDTIDADDVDVCVGSHTGSDERHHADYLFNDEWVCARTGDAREPFTLDTYLAANHVVVGERLQNHIDRTLKILNLSRRNVISLPYCLVAPTLVEDSDLVLTLPRRLALDFKRGRRIQIHELPFQAKPFALHTVWHSRMEVDAGVIWLRQVLQQVARDISTDKPLGNLLPLRRK